jgi:hypothetical protein
MTQEQKDKLPKYFAIKRNETDPMWKEYIQWLNEKTSSDFDGDSGRSIYAYMDGESDLFYSESNMDTKTQIITLSQWAEAVGKSECASVNTEESTRISAYDFVSQKNASLIESNRKLQAFKDYVHSRLDGMGIEKEPNGEHSNAGCRIGDRLDIVEHNNQRLREALVWCVVNADMFSAERERLELILKETE